MQCDFTDLLRAHGLLDTVAVRPGGVFATPVEADDESLAEMAPVKYMHDTAVLITADAPSLFTPRLKLATELFGRTCRKHGLSLNLGAGKTEAVVRFAGAEAQAAKGALNLVEFADGDEVPAFLLTLADDGTLRLVQHYRHLGSVVTQQYGLEQELAARASAASVATAALSRSVLCKTALPAPVRKMVAAACVHSTCLYLGGTWPESAATQMVMFGPAFHRPLRIIVGAHKPGPEGWVNTSSAAI